MVESAFKTLVNVLAVPVSVVLALLSWLGLGLAEMARSFDVRQWYRRLLPLACLALLLASGQCLRLIEREHRQLLVSLQHHLFIQAAASHQTYRIQNKTKTTVTTTALNSKNQSLLALLRQNPAMRRVQQQYTASVMAVANLQDQKKDASHAMMTIVVMFLRFMLLSMLGCLGLLV